MANRMSEKQTINVQDLDKKTSPGSALRDSVLDRIAPILVGCEAIADSNTRLMIQACCLDVVTALEDVIQEYGLDGRTNVSQGGQRGI